MTLSEEKENQMQEFWELLRNEIKYFSKEKVDPSGRNWSENLNEDEDKIGIYLGNSNNIWLYIKSGSSKRCDERTKQMQECSKQIRKKTDGKQSIYDKDQYRGEREGRSIGLKRTWEQENAEEWPEIANWVKDQFELLREIAIEFPFSRFKNRKLANLKCMDDNVKESIFEDDDIEDEREEDSVPLPNWYSISSYGWDSDIQELVRRLKLGDIFVPTFHRGFAWNLSEKSLFIESLIFGLPVPSTFLVQDLETNNLNIVDGQQRLVSIRDFLDGKFALTGENIQDELKGCYFSHAVARSDRSKILNFSDARNLSEAVLHFIIIKPDFGQEDPRFSNVYNQAVIQMFHRLNTSGKSIKAHEVRTSIFHGRLDNLIRELNEHSAWRELFGKYHPRLKDMELILRFIALREDHENYKPPMSSFLDNFMERNREMSEEHAKSVGQAFRRTATFVKETLGEDGLRIGGMLTTPRFDTVMNGFDSYLGSRSEPSKEGVVRLLRNMEKEDDCKWPVDEHINLADRVKMRVQRARTIFGA